MGVTVSLHWRSTGEGMVGTITTCVMSFAVEMHVAGLKTGAENKSA
jgi:hypothetical protein